MLLQSVILAQPIVVNSDAYAAVNSTAYDSINNKIYFNLLNGCATWGIPCAINYSFFAQHNLITKHEYSDNALLTSLESKYQVAGAPYPLINYNSGVANQTKISDNSVFTNFGYYFNRINENLSLPGTIWSYSPATNPSYKEISTFELKGDSVFLFQKDSTSGINYYSLLLKNKFNGVDIPYNSLIASNPLNAQGAIEGYIKNSVLVNNKIILSGIFTASVSGNFIGRNLVSLDISSGQLNAAPVTFTPGSAIYDMKLNNNKIHIAGLFAQVSNKWRNNYAVLDYNLNLTSDSCYFNGDFANNTYVDKIVFYDKYMIAKGNYWAVAGSQFNIFFNPYVIKAVDLSNNTLMPWTFTISGYPVIWQDQVFDMHKNKLYVKRRNYIPSEFFIYCFPPINTSDNILYPGSNLPSPNTSVNICSPSNGNDKIFIAPIRYANTYTWTYSGTNATLVPLGNGSTAKLITTTLSTNGTLSVIGSNDCGLNSTTSTLVVNIIFKPEFVLPPSPLNLICNPDSTLLQANSTNTNTTLEWRINNGLSYTTQPVYAKSASDYHMIITDNLNGCKDSGLVTLQNFKIFPNAKIISHTYLGPIIPIDTITCFKPQTNIVGASDTSGVIISWKSIADNSVFVNPLALVTQNNLKLIVTRSANNCVDSSLIVLVNQNTQAPLISINNYTPQLNCSIYSVSVNAIPAPANCNLTWSGPQNYSSSNPAIINSPGKYFHYAFNPENGCTKIDSVNVVYTPSLVLSKSNDTTVCKNSIAILSAIAQGTLNGISYLWSSGSISSTAIVTPSSTQIYTVNANGPGGCAGTQTIQVNVPADIQDSTITFRDCDIDNSGTLLIYAKGGIPPYKYSVNGSAFTNQNVYGGLAFGNYQINIKDSLGCIITSSANINAYSNLPQPRFLASTKNYKSDTIVLVDISIPRPDSVHWTLPLGAFKIGGDMFNPVIVMPDTGSFNFTMTGFFGDCVIQSTKTIRFLESDSLQADLYNANGIKSCILFPNPNSGEFFVQVEFYKKQNVSLQVWNGNPTKFFQQNYYDTNYIHTPISLPLLPNGTYFLKVIGEFDSKSKIFSINK